jgi:glycosyltransferase involved in cell wall biosynthesis
MAYELKHENTGISVIIPLYNGIEFLPQSIASVVNQTHLKWELIIGVNGYPPDSDVERKAIEIKNMFVNDSHNIIVKHYDTKGAPLTINALARDAKYDYIALLDVDDYWDACKLEVQILYAIVGNYDVVGTSCRYIGVKANMDGIITNFFIPGIPLNEVSKPGFDIFHVNPMICSSILIRKELLEFEDHFVYDYNLWFKLFFQKKRFFNVPEVMVYHRVHKNSAFNNSNSNYVDELKEKWRKIYNLESK